ncbi:hypothetical protein ACFE04_016629 [Oxalis oulophora]
MADGNTQSRYVKLTRAQENAPDEDINPGELNQPVQVPQLCVRRCLECGQTLPESYEPPADEEWTSGIFGCADDFESCRTGMFCPCILFGRNVEAMKDDIPWTNACVCHALCIEGGMTLAAGTLFFNGMIDPQTICLLCEGLFFSWWMCGIYTGIFRESLQKKYHLKEHREMKNRLSDNFSSMALTVVNPPPVQEMNSNEKQESAQSNPSSPSSGNTEHKNMQLQPV